jgi:hypothetical protein
MIARVIPPTRLQPPLAPAAVALCRAQGSTRFHVWQLICVCRTKTTTYYRLCRTFETPPRGMRMQAGVSRFMHGVDVIEGVGGRDIWAQQGSNQNSSQVGWAVLLNV